MKIILCFKEFKYYPMHYLRFINQLGYELWYVRYINQYYNQFNLYYFSSKAMVKKSLGMSLQNLDLHQLARSVNYIYAANMLN